MRDDWVHGNPSACELRGKRSLPLGNGLPSRNSSLHARRRTQVYESGKEHRCHRGLSLHSVLAKKRRIYAHRFSDLLQANSEIHTINSLKSSTNARFPSSACRSVALHLSALSTSLTCIVGQRFAWHVRVLILLIFIISVAASSLNTTVQYFV